MKRPVQSALGPFAWMVLGLTVLGACDSTATISYKETKFDRLQVLSATPLVERDGNVQPTCEVTPADKLAGVDLAFAMKSTKQGGTCGGAPDRDSGIRPGDRIDRVVVTPGDTVSASSFELGVDCVEPYPDPDVASTRSCTGGVSNPTFNIEQLSWLPLYTPPNNPDDVPVRCEGAAVALLIDQSGSMRGFADPDNGFREDQQGAFWVQDDERKAIATDPNNARQAAAVGFIDDLNANDELVVFSFQERDQSADLQVLCTQPPLDDSGDLAGEPEYVRQALACYGVNRGIAKSAVQRAYGGEQGRTPLWEAVRAAYDFLERPDVDAPHNRHIVIVGDGPDTCNVESDEFIRDEDRPQCSSTSYREIKDYVLQHNSAPGADPIHIDFIQIQAKGYPERDARQQELACLTGGQYIFINARNLQLGSGRNDLALALTEALSRVRQSLSGHWTLRSTSPAFDVGPGVAGYLQPGKMFAVGGGLTFKAADFTKQDKLTPFDAGGDTSTGAWDQRVSFRRMCTDDAQCLPAGAVPVQCQIYCSDQQHICLSTPVISPNYTVDDTGAPVPVSCTLDGGDPGVCCGGTCQETCDTHS